MDHFEPNSMTIAQCSTVHGPSPQQCRRCCRLRADLRPISIWTKQQTNSGLNAPQWILGRSRVLSASNVVDARPCVSRLCPWYRDFSLYWRKSVSMPSYASSGRQICGKGLHVNIPKVRYLSDTGINKARISCITGSESQCRKPTNLRRILDEVSGWKVTRTGRLENRQEECNTWCAFEYDGAIPGQPLTSDNSSEIHWLEGSSTSSPPCASTWRKTIPVVIGVMNDILEFWSVIRIMKLFILTRYSTLD